MITGALLYLATAPFVANAFTIEDLVEVHRNHLSLEDLEKLMDNYRDGTYTSRHLQAYPEIIDELFANRNAIERSVEAVYNGVVATTTSTEDYVTNLIRTHVGQMATLTSPIRQGDPLFVSLFQNIEQTSMEYVNIEGGVRVEHLATTDCGLLLVQDHADSVSYFVNTGNRQPNFSWIEPSVCASPQLIDVASSTTTTTTTTTVIPPATTPTAANPTASSTLSPPTTVASTATSIVPSSPIETASTVSLPVTTPATTGAATSTLSSPSDDGEIASLVERDSDSSCGGHNVGTVFGILLGLCSLWCF
eukprot:scaffold3069_cov215-Amphora_coffeaeformis.AAC.31